MERPRCANHPQNPAVALCVGCGRYLCAECVREREARAYCPSCAEVDSGAGTDRMDERAVSGTSSHGEDVVTAAWRGFDMEDNYARRPPGSADPQVPSAGTGGPVAARVVATCAFHPRVRAVARCGKCGALICAGCQRAVGGKRFCESCFRETVGCRGKAVFDKGASGGETTVPFQPVTSWKLWPGLAFLPVPFALSGLMTYMMRQGEEVSVGAAQLLISLLLYSTTLCFAFLTASRYGNPRRRLGMHADNLPAGLGLGIICGSLAFWIAAASSLLSAGVFNRLGWIEDWLRSFFDVNVKSVTGADLLVAGLIIVIAAPICEEIFFRGFLYPAMRRRLGVWGAVFLNGLLFSAVHFSLFGLLGRTLAGALFCLLYEYTDNLWSPVAAHALNNFVAFFLPLAFIWSS